MITITNCNYNYYVLLLNTILSYQLCFIISLLSGHLFILDFILLLQHRFWQLSVAVELKAEKVYQIGYRGFQIVWECKNCRTFVELNLGSTHGTPSESDVAPVSLQSRTYSVRFGTWKVRRLNQAWTRPKSGNFFGLICTSATITSSFKLKITYFIETANLAPVVQKWDSTIHLINLYPEDNAIGFHNT